MNLFRVNAVYIFTLFLSMLVSFHAFVCNFFSPVFLSCSSFMLLAIIFLKSIFFSTYFSFSIRAPAGDSPAFLMSQSPLVIWPSLTSLPFFLSSVPDCSLFVVSIKWRLRLSVLWSRGEGELRPPLPLTSTVNLPSPVVDSSGEAGGHDSCCTD